MTNDSGRRRGENDVVGRIAETTYGTVSMNEVLQMGGAVEEGELLVVNGAEGRVGEIEREEAFGEAVVGIVQPQLLRGVVYSLDFEWGPIW